MPGLRIAIVGQGVHPIPHDGYAPVEKHIWNLTQALRRRGEDVHLVNRVLPRFKFRLLAHAVWAAAKLRRIRPDVVHCHSPINAWVLRRLGVRPIVFTSHSRQWTFDGARGARSQELRNHRRGYRAAHARIVLAPAVRSAIQQDPGLRALPCHVVPNGVDIDRLQPPAGRRSERALVGVGIVARVKRWHVAARAAREAGWRLEVVGPIAEPDAAAEIRAALPDVALRGEVPDEEVQAALHRATVLVHPSSAEAMPFAVLEGMATGLPVLGGEALRDVVEDGVEGRLVPEPAGSRGEAALAGAYASVLRATPPDAWAAMGERARRRVVERNSWDAVAAATCEVYRLVRERTS